MHICICKCICKYIFIRKIIFQTPFVSFHDATQVFRDVTFVFGYRAKKHGNLSWKVFV